MSTSPATPLARSARFGTFALVFSTVFPVLYVICYLANLPLFTYHPGVFRFDLGWVAPRKGEGPAMYWYGWTASCIIGSALLGGLATLLPHSLARKIPAFQVWLLPIAAVPFLVYSLMMYWTKG